MIVPFHVDHVFRMAPQAAQVGSTEAIHLDALRDRAASGRAYTLMDADIPVACAGLSPMGEGSAAGWALLSLDAGKYMLELTRAVKDGLQKAPETTILIEVAVGFEAGERWARMLGFRKANIEPERREDGLTYQLWVYWK